MTTAGVPDAAALAEPPRTRWAAHVGGLPRSFWFLWAGTLVNRLQAGQLGALVAAIAPPHLRGRYMGAFGFSFGAAAFLAPALGTQVLSRAGEDALWGASFVLCCLAGVGLLLVADAAERRSRVAT